MLTGDRPLEALQTSLPAVCANAAICKVTATDKAPVPFKASWLTGVGLLFFFLNLALFGMNCVLITLRFHYRPQTFKASFTDQVESLFTAAVVSLCYISPCRLTIG
jgi:hypothetical protein